MKHFLSVVIPAYNEQANIQRGSLGQAVGYLENTSLEWEVIVVDDGSTDGTGLVLRQFCDRYPHCRYVKIAHQGKAGAIFRGLSQAKGELVLFSDFDQATPMSEMEKLLPFIDKGYDIVIGSREVKGARREKEPFYRHLMGKAFNLVVKFFTLRGVADTQCGFKLFRRTAAHQLFHSLKVYPVQLGKPIRHPFTGAVDVELLFLAQKYGYKVAEVPVLWTHYQTTRVHPLRDSWLMFADVLKIRWCDLNGGYAGQ